MTQTVNCVRFEYVNKEHGLCKAGHIHKPSHGACVGCSSRIPVDPSKPALIQLVVRSNIKPQQIASRQPAQQLPRSSILPDPWGRFYKWAASVHLKTASSNLDRLANTISSSRRSQLEQLTKDYPIDLRSRYHLCRWVNTIHNVIRSRLGQPIIEYTSAASRHGMPQSESINAPMVRGVHLVNENMDVDHVKLHINASAGHVHRAPDQWEHWANTQAAHHELLDTFLDHLSTFSGEQGRGVVMCAGGRFFVSAYVTIRVLRHVGCQLPVEIWYLGRNNEKEAWMEDATRELNVTWIDGDEVAKSHPCRILNGWELKAFAVLHTQFEEVLSLDADSYPVRDPTYLFDEPEYLRLGALFFPDSTQEDLHLWCVSRGVPDVRTVFGLPAVHEPAFESGQFLVNRKVCWKAVNAAWWLNDHSDFTYRLFYGDKESFHIGWRFVGQDYAMPNKRWIANNPPQASRDNWAHTMQQHDMQGNIIFYHRCGAKFKFEPANNFMTSQRWDGEPNPNMQHEDFCWSVVEELRGMRRAA